MSVLHIDQENYEQLVLQSQKPVLLDFWAPWCGPCRMVAPIIEEIAEEYDGIVVGKVNVDENMELASRFKVVSIPTLVVMENGQIKTTAVGFRSKDAVLKLLDL